MFKGRSVELEGMFVHYAGNNVDAFKCALWAFGEGFEYYTGKSFVESWNTRNGDECFFMSEGDGVPESVSKIVKHWGESMGVKQKKVSKAVTVCHGTGETVLPKGTPINCTARVYDETGLEKLELKQAISVAEKAGKLGLINSERIDKVVKLIKAGDNDLVKVIKAVGLEMKRVDAQKQALEKLVERVYLLGDYNKTLNNKVKAMASDIEKIKGRMQVAQKVNKTHAPKVEGKFQKAAKKVEKKLPKSFGGIR